MLGKVKSKANDHLRRLKPRISYHLLKDDDEFKKKVDIYLDSSKSRAFSITKQTCTQFKGYSPGFKIPEFEKKRKCPSLRKLEVVFKSPVQRKTVRKTIALEKKLKRKPRTLMTNNTISQREITLLSKLEAVKSSSRVVHNASQHNIFLISRRSKKSAISPKGRGSIPPTEIIKSREERKKRPFGQFQQLRSAVSSNDSFDNNLESILQTNCDIYRSKGKQKKSMKRARLREKRFLTDDSLGEWTRIEGEPSDISHM